VGSLDEAQRALIQRAVERCKFAHSCIEWVTARLDINPTTLESRIKTLASSPSGDSEFSEALRILGEFESIERTVVRVPLSLPHCSIGHFILDVRYLPRWPASCEVNQEACPGHSGADREMNLDRLLDADCGPFATQGEQS
jgi:hypothetical protein